MGPSWDPSFVHRGNFEPGAFWCSKSPSPQPSPGVPGEGVGRSHTSVPFTVPALNLLFPAAWHTVQQLQERFAARRIARQEQGLETPCNMQQF